MCTLNYIYFAIELSFREISSVLYLNARTRSFARGIDTKSVRSRDAQSP